MDRLKVLSHDMASFQGKDMDFIYKPVGNSCHLVSFTHSQMTATYNGNTWLIFFLRIYLSTNYNSSNIDDI